MSDLLYTPEGWLNMQYIGSMPAWLIVIIGKRQVGKTYGTLRYMLDKGIYHILLRRTTAELDTISASPDLNPYKVFEPDYHTGLFRQAKKICRICDYSLDPEGKAIPGAQRGIATSLAEIAHIRGFNGSAFSDMVFDEFIPEKGVVTRRTEGDAFLNAYTTINGNRELAGSPPLRCWLLANSNNIASPILESLNLTDDVLYMRRKGREDMLTDKGVYIIQPDSERVTSQRKETALMKQISAKSDFYGMAMENAWSYDDSPYIKNMPLKGMQPAWAYDDTIFAWKHPQGYYICRAPFKGHNDCKYDGSRTDRERLAMEWSIMKPYYYAGCCTFSDLRTMSLFKSIFDMT